MNPNIATLTTDDMGVATYTVTGPKSTKDNTDTGRTGELSFSSDLDGNGTTGTPPVAIPTPMRPRGATPTRASRAGTAPLPWDRRLSTRSSGVAR